MNEPGKLYVKTFGCQMNVYDSEKIYAFLQDSYVPAASEEEADVIILNTCSIREKAENKVYSHLGRFKPLKKINPDLLIGVGGCVAQQEGERILKRAPSVDVVFGTHNLDELSAMLAERKKSGKRICRVREDTGTVPTADAPRVMGARGATSLLTIMKGCNNYCAYCVVPFVRGREVSRPASEILDEALFLVDKGVREITLLGQNVNSYQDPDTGTGFVSLLESMDLLPGLERLRFVTSHPKDFSPELAHAMADLPTVCEHIHLPVQAGSDRVLSAMKRGYTSSQYMEKVELLRKLIPEVEFTTDIIVGFPGEEREDFERTSEILNSVKYQNIFSFRFSPRPGTAAAAMNDPVNADVKRSWLPELQDLQNLITAEKHRNMIGREVEVLVEEKDKKKNGFLEGRTRTNYIVHFPGDPDLAGKIVRIRLTSSRAIHVMGEMVN
ncbi:MAG: tRNA (N6-isopentenyl adenosine(37)-C2)-methylthiotransferase MiaB [bacterium]|nr:tRNA (N6-isopentenyl adenosine(37)-C2)-methylthiotransferase MiaB [bacterium]MDT8366527.1 tRNA (N6-isopentenyl adenosine(37)-C2)-methylthiotransferase MiaB [bacterium]